MVEHLSDVTSIQREVVFLICLLQLLAVHEHIPQCVNKSSLPKRDFKD